MRERQMGFVLGTTPGGVVRLWKEPNRCCRQRWRRREARVTMTGPSVGESDRVDSIVDNDISFSSAISTKKRLSEALEEACEEALFNLPIGAVVDLGVVYVSAAYEDRKVGLMREKLDSVVQQVRELVPGLRNVIGGTVAGILGADISGRCTEVEAIPAVSVTFIRVPGAQVNLFHIEDRDLPSLDGPPDAWQYLVGGAKPAGLPTFLLLSNASFYSSGALEGFLRGVDFAYPGSVKIGGVVGTPSPQAGLLYATLKKDLMSSTSKSYYSDGLVGATITGGIEADTIVTQGVRGVGPIFTVQKMSKNSLMEVDIVPAKSGVPANTIAADRALKMVVSEASQKDQKLLFKNPLLGIADDESKEDLRDGDYLCRQIQGIDPRTGGISLSESLRNGQRIRFHVRDADAAIAEMEAILDRAKRNDLTKTLQGTVKPIVGTMAISDVTRGIKFFREQNVDSTTFVRYAPTSLTGFFGLAQIAPIGGKRSPTHTHESTAVFTVFRRAMSESTQEEEESEES